MRRLALAFTVLTLGLALAATAQSQLISKGNVLVSFDARLLPRDLPRERPAPVTVHLDGSVGTLDGTRPPQLRQLSIAVNRAGRLSVLGLPACTAPQIQQTSTESALAACRPALVGHGRFAAGVDFQDAPQIPARGKVLVFNAKFGGRPGMLLHLYGSSPVRAAFVLPFKISRPSRGEFGMVFTTKIPTLASDLGYITDIELTIGRTYRHAGKRRSFLSASCAAPPGFPGAVYQLAKATFSFPEMRMTSRLPSDCRVR